MPITGAGPITWDRTRTAGPRSQVRTWGPAAPAVGVAAQARLGKRGGLPAFSYIGSNVLLSMRW